MVRIFLLLIEIELCSPTSIGSSRRGLLSYVPEHRSILKYNQNTYYTPRFSFSPKTGIVFPKTVLLSSLFFGALGHTTLACTITLTDELGRRNSGQLTCLK